MSGRIVALALGSLLVTSAVATDALPLPNVCRMARNAVPVDSLVGYLATSPQHASLLADAGDGRVTAVRRALDAMPNQEALRWRQSAMMFAVQAGQPTVVAALLDDGADANATALLPGYKQAFLGDTLNPAIRKAFAQAGALNDHDTPIGPALAIASSCGDVATVDALLRHHAEPAARSAPNTADALTTAVLQGNAAIVERLLDHGADACADDRRLHQRQLASQRGAHSLAELGQRAGLPSKLIARLTCVAVASAP